MKQFVISVATAIVKIAVFVFLVRYVAETAAAAYGFGYRVFTEEPVSASETGTAYMVELSEDTTPKQIAEALEDYGLIRDKNLFYIQYLCSSYKDKLVPGYYELNTAMTAEEMLAVMSSSYAEEENAN